MQPIFQTLTDCKFALGLYVHLLSGVCMKAEVFYFGFCAGYQHDKCNTKMYSNLVMKGLLPFLGTLRYRPLVVDRFSSTFSSFFKS